MTAPPTAGFIPPKMSTILRDISHINEIKPLLTEIRRDINTEDRKPGFLIAFDVLCGFLKRCITN